MTAQIFLVLLLSVLYGSGWGIPMDGSSDSWELSEGEAPDVKALSELVNNPRGKVFIQIVNHGNVGFLNSEPRRSKFDPGNAAFEHDVNTAEGRHRIRLENSGVNKIPKSSLHDGPPPPEDVAKMARYIVKNSNWTSLATISTREPTVGSPFNNIVSVSDGPVGKSTGVPYMYVTSLDLSIRDIKQDNRASLTMSLAQSDYCRDETLDPEDPRCAHVILTGKFVKIQNGTQEADFARTALFSKHPIMPSWPTDHGFFFAKLEIANIIVLDFFGGAKTVTPKDYFKANVY